jgi:DNA-binding CsgD family transcriptional regulator
MRRIGPITRRETQILELLSQYHTYEDIGKVLGINIVTVYWHISRIMLKTNVHKKELLIKYAIDNGYGKKRRLTLV